MQGWNVHAIVSSQENMCTTKKRHGWNAGTHVESRYDVTFIVQSGIKLRYISCLTMVASVSDIWSEGTL